MLALLTTSAPDEAARNRALALFGAVSSGGASIGLILGGLLTDVGSWRWTLFINVPLGIAVLLLARRFVTETARRPGRFDLVGAASATIGAVSIVWALIGAPEHGWTSVRTIGGIVARRSRPLLLLARTETRHPHPMIQPHLVRNRRRVAALAVMALVIGANLSMFFLVVQYVAAGAGLRPARVRLRVPALQPRHLRDVPAHPVADRPGRPARHADDRHGRDGGRLRLAQRRRHRRHLLGLGLRPDADRRTLDRPGLHADLRRPCWAASSPSTPGRRPDCCRPRSSSAAPSAIAVIVSVYAAGAVPGEFVPGLQAAFLTSAGFTAAALVVSAIALRPAAARGRGRPEVEAWPPRPPDVGDARSRPRVSEGRLVRPSARTSDECARPTTSARRRSPAAYRPRRIGVEVRHHAQERQRAPDVTHDRSPHSIRTRSPALRRSQASAASCANLWVRAPELQICSSLEGCDWCDGEVMVTWPRPRGTPYFPSLQELVMSRPGHRPFAPYARGRPRASSPPSSPATALAVLGGSEDAATGRRGTQRARGNVVTPGDFTGYGFDQCQAPEPVRRWTAGCRARRSSPSASTSPATRAPAASQTNLDADLGQHPARQRLATAADHARPPGLVPAAVPALRGRQDDQPQARQAGPLRRAALHQGIAEATKTVGVAQGARHRTGQHALVRPRGLRLENTACRESALSFLSGWTRQIRALGYLSGVYSSAGSGIVALDNARVNRPTSFNLPDQIWIARWDGGANTTTSYIREDGWTPHARVKQYQGGHDETWGGVKINIDRNFLDVGRGSVATPELHCGGVTIALRHLRHARARRRPTVTPPPAKVKALQCLLQEQGVYAGKINGSYDAATIKAANAWQPSTAARCSRCGAPRTGCRCSPPATRR